MKTDRSSTRKDWPQEPLWRTTEERAGIAQRTAGHEFPPATMLPPDGVARREFLKVAAASVVAAGAASCDRGVPTDLVVPQINHQDIVADAARSFATAIVEGGYAIGVAVTSWNGRPTKIEGNPDHPASLGATDARTQAAVMGLYDPDRSKTLRRGKRVSTWTTFERALAEQRNGWRQSGGAGLRVLTGTVTSPTSLRELAALKTAYPAMRWHRAEPLDDVNAREAGVAAFGRPVDRVLHLDRADVIVALDSDFLAEGPGHVRHACDVGARRQGGAPRPSRLYATEPCPTITGTNADERLRVRRSAIGPVAARIATLIGLPGVDREPLEPEQERWALNAVADLQRSGGASLIIAGPAQPRAVHVLAHAINERLGNTGKTTEFIDPVEPAGDDAPRDLESLVADIRAGQVRALIVLDTNPVYWADPAFGLESALASVPFTAHLGLYWDETGRACGWHIPMAHDLESWGDARAFDGTATILQPLIEPLYGGRTPHELLDLLHNDLSPGPLALVKQTWRERGSDDPMSWRTTLRRGTVEGTASGAVPVRVKPDAVALAASQLSGSTAAEMEISLAPDPTIGDGRHANNPWLQELPKPESTLTWRNAAAVSPADAKRLGLQNGDELEISAGGRGLRAPVWITPGHADGAVTLTLGYGRGKGAGALAEGRGYNAYPLRSEGRWCVPAAELAVTGKCQDLSTTQRHFQTEGRDIVRVGLTGSGRGNGGDVHLSLYPEVAKTGPQWGMCIDLTACIGCSACVVACQAENNIPCVGEDEVARGREMHWIRVDRYHRGTAEDPDFYHQPVPCMHCENAPCELVCPVGATQHSADGLNEMVYNRCVGTRYCSNNCPYKVRRFNFFRFADWESPTVALQYNPRVSVRARGVMEKCTYCVQRIRAAEIVARRESRPIGEGEIVTACQQVCPTRAIVFGNTADPNSAVSRAKARPGNYAMLGDLNTRPRTTYYPVVRNPAPGENPA